MDLNIGFIGVGNMGAALVKGILKSHILPAERIFIFDTDEEKTLGLKADTGVNVSNGSDDLVKKSDVIIVAVKPNIVKQALESCKAAFTCEKLLISVAAGLPIKYYKDIIGYDKKVVRTMPNTPALVGEGMTLVSYGGTVDDADIGTTTKTDIETVIKLFECVGKVEILDEKFMNDVIALTSSSPAYVFIFIEAMADAAVLSGLPRLLAYKLASQAVLGAAKMVLETGKNPGELKDQVCSPGGTTIEAVSALEKNCFRYAVIEAMKECTKKAREIGEKYK